MYRAAGSGASQVSIHPAISRAFFAFPPDLAYRAQEVVRSMRPKRILDNQLEEWSGSRLTGDGFPLEVSFCTSDDRLRFTIEPAPVSLDPGDRFDFSVELLESLSAVPIPHEVVDDLRSLQSCISLKYGSWIGCRIGKNGSAFKLYVEVPEDRKEVPFCMSPFQLSYREIRPRMIAYALESEEFELYLRLPSLGPNELTAVLAPVEMEDRAPWLLDFIEAMHGYAIRGRLPGPSVGVSYVLGPSPRVTLYFYARAIWGSDARIRRGFCCSASALGWDTKVYRDITRPMAERNSWRCFHGLFGITLNSSPTVSLTIGVRPVAS